jgi:ubiquitin-like protein Pup
MSTKDTGGQEQANRRTDEVDETEPPEADAGAVAERKAALDADVDSMLDEIDEVLETNAEEFVRGFVQKGGE